MICGDGVALRPVLEEDLDALAAWSRDALTPALFSPGFLRPEEAVHKWFAGLLESQTRIALIIQRLENPTAVGLVGLEHIQYRNQEAEIAGLIIAPSQRGQGLATRGVKTLIRYAFEDLNLHRLFARIHSSNQPALRVARKAGLTREGVLRESVLVNECYLDIVYLALLREEWKNDD